MEAELFKMLKDYLSDDYCAGDTALLLMVKRAIFSFRAYMNYPESFSEEKIENDLWKNEFCLFDLALYMCNVQGIEFQKSHSESGTSRSFNSESEIYALHGVVPYVSI